MNRHKSAQETMKAHESCMQMGVAVKREGHSYLVLSISFGVYL